MKIADFENFIPLKVNSLLERQSFPSKTSFKLQALSFKRNENSLVEVKSETIKQSASLNFACNVDYFG
jgi:hypothetical protein